LRYYEEVGILTSHRKDDSKYREYDREQCERLEIILLLRRLSFSVKTIVSLLNGDDAHFRGILNGKIADSGKKLLEMRETDQILRDLAAELSTKQITALRAADILGNYTYLTNKTERMIPLKPRQEEEYRIVLGAEVVPVCTENAGNLIEKIRKLRTELEKESVTLPRIRIYDDVDLVQNQVVIIWDGKEVWRKDFSDVTVCADEIIKQIKLISLNK